MFVSVLVLLFLMYMPYWIIKKIIFFDVTKKEPRKLSEMEEFIDMIEEYHAMVDD